MRDQQYNYFKIPAFSPIQTYTNFSQRWLTCANKISADFNPSAVWCVSASADLFKNKAKIALNFNIKIIALNTPRYTELNKYSNIE